MPKKGKVSVNIDGPRTSHPTQVIVQAPRSNVKNRRRKSKGVNKRSSNDSSGLAIGIPRSFDRSLYAASLMDPWGVRGARIPDESVLPTSTFTSVYRTTLTPISTAGTHACGAKVLLGNLSPNGTSPIFIAGGSAAGLNFNTTSVTYTNAAAILSSTQSVRVVSAGLAVQSTSSTANNQGKIVLAQFPSYPDAPGSDTSIGVFQNAYPYSKVCPVGLNGVCSIQYRPWQSYMPFFPTGNNTGTSIASSMGGFAVFCHGLSSTATVELVVIVNWEAIPNTAFAGILPTEKSFSDPIAFAKGLNLARGESMFQRWDDEVMSATNGMFSDTSDAYQSWNHMFPSLHSLENKMWNANALIHATGTAIGTGWNLYSSIRNRLRLGGAQYAQAPQVMYAP